MATNAVLAIVRAGTITSSPTPTPAANNAECMVTVPLACAIPYLTPNLAANSCSNLPVMPAEDVFRTLATEALADRVHNPGLERERADVIVGGMCVLVSLYRKLGLERILVSEADILDGLALSLLR